MKPPPDWKVILEERGAEVLALKGKVDLTKANQCYYYWDKFRSQPMECDRELAWTYLRLQRDLQMHKVDLDDFAFWLPEHLLKQLHEIDTVTLDLDHVGPQHAGARRHLIHSLMEEAITSSQVEGAATTMRDAKKMLTSGRKPHNRSEQMIYNNYQTMIAIKGYADEPLTEELLKEIHTNITLKTLRTKEDEGRYRTAKEDVRIESPTGDIIHTPPPADQLPADIKALCHFANNHQEPFIHPVVKAIILHFWLAYLHPFIDGNGRTARALVYWYLIKHGYWYFEYLSISKAILKRLGQYGKAYLYTELDHDLTYFIHYNLKVISEAVASLKDYLDFEETKLEEAVQVPGLNLRQSRFILEIGKQAYTIKSYQKSYGIAYQTARTDLLDLEKRGLLKRHQKGKAFYFTVTRLAPET